MRIAIHQPNFCAWFPFFQKIEQSDVFVILNHVQFEKNNYQNRFNYNNEWYTMSVESGLVPITEKNYIQPLKDWSRIKTKLPKYARVLSQFDDCITYSLSITNSRIIHKSVELLGIKTPIYSDYQTDLKSTERLIHICKTHGANEYLSGISGAKYMDLDLFKAHGINVVFQDETKMQKKTLMEALYDRMG